VHSELGRGSTFFLRLPLQGVAPRAAPDARPRTGTDG
jgi:hypothetical protein